MAADRAAYAGGQAFGPTARDRVASRAGRDFVYRADRLSVADAAEGLSAVHYRARLFLRLARRRLVREDQFCVAAASARSGGPRSEPVGRGHRQSIGQDDRERRAARVRRGQEGQKPAPAKAGGRKRHIVTDTCGLLVGAEVHPADVQDRAGASLVIEAVHQLFPWLRHLFADSVYTGPNLHEALAKFGKWTIEIVKRAADAAGFQLLPRRWVVERTLAWLNRNRRLAKDFEASIASAKAWVYIASVQLLIRRLA